LQTQGYHKLALIVASGKRVELQKELSVGKLDIKLIHEAINFNLEELKRMGLIGNWFEELAVLVCKKKSVTEAIQRF
jgi:hypothetical protein